jgi:hypothetical protein
MGRKTLSSENGPGPVRERLLDEILDLRRQLAGNDDELVEVLRDQIADLRKQRDYFQGKCDRLEMHIERGPAPIDNRVPRKMREEIPTAHDQPKENLDSVRGVQAPIGGVTKAHAWHNLQSKWDSMSAAEQARALGDDTDPRPTQVDPQPAPPKVSD